MSYIEKERLIKADIESIENRVRHAFNQGYDLGYKEGKERVKPHEQEPFINKPCVSSGVCEHDKQKVLDKVRAEITDCLKALDEIEKSGFNIYLPNEISGRRLTYQQCLKFIDKHKAESDPQESEDKE